MSIPQLEQYLSASTAARRPGQDRDCVLKQQSLLLLLHISVYSIVLRTTCSSHVDVAKL
jgi:hypothetical protein